MVQQQVMIFAAKQYDLYNLSEWFLWSLRETEPQLTWIWSGFFLTAREW